VLVNFGGFDAAMQTHHAMLALKDFAELEVDFVAGADNPAWAQMQALAATRPHWRLHSFVSDFQQRMTAADLFIGAGGGTSWERAALGLPTICIAVSNNQQANGEVMAAAGAHVFMGLASRSASNNCAMPSVLSSTMSICARVWPSVHGNWSMGAVRCAWRQRWPVPCSTLRPATLDDAQLLFDGRNAEAVRRWSLDTAAIEWPQHLNWLTASLRNPQRLLLIAEADDGPVGVLRYDLRGFEAEVSLYLLHGRFGLGWGRALLARGEAFVREHWPQMTAITAQVLPGNRPSLNVFRDAGFTQSACAFTKVLKDHRDE
jgi:RimJ/RimL family protein N-acetyltransferase